MDVVYKYSTAGASRNKPNMIVVHAMAEWLTVEDIDYHAVEWLAHKGYSSHAFVTPSGVVVRTRADGEGAYHAKGYNTNTLGVEFLVSGLHDYDTFLTAMKRNYLTEPQYFAGLELVKKWMNKYDIPKERVVMHSDIDPKRKFDAGEGFVNSGFFNEL
jgi:N-acetyl-anhydromuramyl-L-alanine amidase AmpD